MTADSILGVQRVYRSLGRIRTRRRTGLPRTGRIFGVGLSRTATTTLSAALSTLEYRTFHFPADDSTRERIMACLAREDQSLQLPILDQRDALMDTPVAATFEALDAGYPGSKFILTTRDKEPWLDSCLQLWTSWVYPYLRDHGDEPLAAYIRAIHENLYGGSTFDRDRFSRAFDDHRRRVEEHFRQRPSDLLTIDVCAGQGWAPLCEFLDRPEPQATFPWIVHTEGEWRDISGGDEREA